MSTAAGRHRQPHNKATTTNTFAQQYTPQTASQSRYNHKHLCTTIHPTDNLTIKLHTTTNTFAQQYTPQTASQ